MYGDWGDDFPENVWIGHCHNYWDYRPPYPPHPIWNHSGNRPGERSPYVLQVALVGDSAGMNFLPCSMAHRWQEDFRTAADKGYEGCDANMAVHPEYVDHPLNLSNWHTYGKLCWNPYLDPDDILCEWLTMEYGADAVVFLPGLRETYPATIGALFSRSAFTQCHSYVARYNYLATRLNGPWRVWTDLLHPGMDRVGENVLGLELPLDAYPEAQRLALRNDPRYQLVFNRMPLTDAYAAELMAEKRVATGHMEGVLSAWQQLEGKIDPASFAQVAGLLEANVNDVRIFVDCFGLYLDYKLGRLEAAQIEAMRALRRRSEGRGDGRVAIRRLVLGSLWLAGHLSGVPGRSGEAVAGRDARPVLYRRSDGETVGMKFQRGTRRPVCRPGRPSRDRIRATGALR